ncbi:MAG: chemotaxis protein CheW [Rhodospirillales bacterium]|nr:chemotaxis protein CheW [Rhodospirillales bacterium]
MMAILFEAGGTRYAVPADTVVEVRAVPPVTPLPFVPPYVQGLVGAGGRVIPMVELTARLGTPRNAPGPAGECLVLAPKDGAPLALRIDRVLLMLTVPESDFQPLLSAEAEDRDIRHAVVGEFPWQGHTVLMLDADRLALTPRDSDDDSILTGDGSLMAALRAERGGNHEHADESEPFLVVQSGSEHVALPLSLVEEVVEMRDISSLPGAPEAVRGLGILRGLPLLVMRLGRLWGAGGGDDADSVVIVGWHGHRMGLVVDRILGIQRYKGGVRHDAERRDGVSGYAVDDNRRMVYVIDLDGVVPPPLWERCRSYLPRDTGLARKANATVETRRFLTFHLGREVCAVELDRVQRVVPFSGAGMTPVKGGRNHVTGMIDVGGTVTPVVDLRRIFGAEAASLGEAASLVVVREGDEHWGLVVDRLERIAELPVSMIEPAGSASVGFVGEIGRLSETLVSILTLEPLRAVV